MSIRELSFVSQDPIASLPYTRYRVKLNAASDELPAELGKLARSLKWQHKTAILADITNCAILSPVPLASQDDRYMIIDEESINLAEPRYDRYLFQACNFALCNAFENAKPPRIVDRKRQRIYFKDKVTKDGMECQRYLKFDFIRDGNQHLVLVLDFANEYHSQLTIDELKPGDRLIHSYDGKVCEFVRIDEEKTISTPLSDLGNQSVIDYHREKKHLDDELLNSLDPSTPAVTVKYKNSGKRDFEASHMPQLLRKIYDREDVENSFFNKQLLSIGEKVSYALKSIKFLNGKNRFLLNGTPVKFSESLRTPRNLQDFKQGSRKNNLDFGKRIFPYPAAGMKAHKLLEKPEEIRAYILYPQSWESDARRYTGDLKSEIQKFGINLKRVDQSYDPFNQEQIIKICQDIKEACNFVIAYVPQPGEKEFTREVNPYELIKQEFLKRQLPSQMITQSTLKRRWDEYIGRNLILGINAKLGYLSWRLKDMPGKAQAFIGLDFGRKNRDTVAAAFLIDRTGRTIGWSTAKFPVYREALDRVQLMDWLRKFVILYNEYFKCQLQHLVIHRDGDVRDAEMEAISDLQKHVAGIEQVDVVEVIKSGTCRAVEYNPQNAKNYSNPDSGYAWEYARNEAVILTTRLQTKEENIAPRPLRIRKRMGDTDLLTLAEQVYWLSLMQVGTTQTTRLPITTYYADRAASRALKDLLPSDDPSGIQRDRRLWFL